MKLEVEVNHGGARSSAGLFHNVLEIIYAQQDKDDYRPMAEHDTHDAVAAVSATETCLLVARESGLVQRYTLPYLQAEGRFQVG